MAVQTRVFPLYEVINGKYVLNRKISNPKPVGEYLKMQKRFAYLMPQEIETIQLHVDEEYERILRLSKEVDLEAKLSKKFKVHMDKLKQEMDAAYEKLQEDFKRS